MKRISSATFVAINLAVICGAAFLAFRPTLRELCAVVGVIASTFVGAWLALQFGAERLKQDQRDKDLSAGNVALIVLIEFLDRNRQYQKQYIEPVRHNSDCWWIMRPGDLDSPDLKVDHTGLSFLLPANAGAWRAIVSEERHQKILAKTIADRTRLMIEIVFPRFENAGLQHGQAVTGEDVERILGPTITGTLKDDTNIITDLIENNIRSLENSIEILRLALTAVYPGARLVAPHDGIRLASISQQ